MRPLVAQRGPERRDALVGCGLIRSPRRPFLRPPAVATVEVARNLHAGLADCLGFITRETSLAYPLIKDRHVLVLPASAARNPNIQLVVEAFESTAGTPKGLLKVHVPAGELSCRAL